MARPTGTYRSICAPACVCWPPACHACMPVLAAVPPCSGMLCVCWPPCAGMPCVHACRHAGVPCWLPCVCWPPCAGVPTCRACASCACVLPCCHSGRRAPACVRAPACCVCVLPCCRSGRRAPVRRLDDQPGVLASSSPRTRGRSRLRQGREGLVVFANTDWILFLIKNKTVYYF